MAAEDKAVMHLRQALAAAQSQSLKQSIQKALSIALSGTTDTQPAIWFPNGLRSDYPDFQQITGARAIVDDNAPEVTNEDDLIVVVHHSTRLVGNLSDKIKIMPSSKRVFFVLAELGPRPGFVTNSDMETGLASKGWNGKNFAFQSISYQPLKVTGHRPDGDTAEMIKRFFAGETVGSARLPGREEIIHALIRAKGNPQEAVKVIQSYQ